VRGGNIVKETEKMLAIIAETVYIWFFGYAFGRGPGVELAV
jgi:hypothetical protein